MMLIRSGDRGSLGCTATHHASGAAVELQLADFLLPLAFATNPCPFHRGSNQLGASNQAWVIGQFAIADILIVQWKPCRDKSKF